jgi:hypothetical protein
MVALSRRRSLRHTASESGQVAVEAALVMPLFVFFILGILQLGLIAQARVVAKYAAYRAARVGAMNNGDPRAIESAAILHLLPVLANNSDVIMPSTNSGEVVGKFMQHNAMENRLPSGEKMVSTVICSPLAEDVRGGGSHDIGSGTQTGRGGVGSNSEADFDDPLNQSSPDNFTTSGDAVRRYKRMRLVVQVQLLYRMPIPFANWVMVKSYLGTNLPSVLMMPNKNGTPRGFTGQAGKVYAAEAAGAYVLPINVSYAMRMQSNFFLSRFALPTSNQCVSYGNPTGS